MKYSFTTPDPGDKVVLIYGLTLRPLATAFLATSPAASITSGFDVLVHDVIAAITTEPWERSYVYPLKLIFTFFPVAVSGNPYPLNPTLAESPVLNSYFNYDIGTLSWGLFGPESDGSIVDKSRLMISPE